MKGRSLNIDHLIKKCKLNNRDAQQSLYNMYKVDMFRICMRYGKNKAEAEDMLQEGFMYIFKDIKSYEGKGNFDGWLKKVMLNASLMYIRKYNKLKTEDIAFGDPKFEVLVSDTIDEMDNASNIIFLIQKLPINYQIIFNLKVIDGYEYKEIANKLEMKEVTVRSNFLRARKSLQKMVENSLINKQ